MELPKDFKPKSFWEKPEGTTGMIFSVLIAVGIAFVAYQLLPFIITLLANTLYAGLLFAGVAILGYAVFNKKTRLLASYMFKSAMRKITGFFVTIDPIGILKNYVEDLRDNASEMQQQITKLKGQMKILKGVIDSNEKERTNALDMALQAKKQSMNAVVTLKARKAGRLEESNVTLQTLYNKMEMIHRVLTKMFETCGILIEDLSDEVDVKEREYKAINASYSAFKSALKIINGDPDRKEMFDQAMEFLSSNYQTKLGEIEDFMETSKGFLDSIDLQSGIYEESALKMLEDWENKTDSLILGDKQAVINNINPMIATDKGAFEVKEKYRL